MTKRERALVEKIALALGLEAAGILLALKNYSGADKKPVKREGFSLVKVPSKKYGILYYVRYKHGGKLLPSKWSCGTSVESEAVSFAVKNRDAIVGAYLKSKRLGVPGVPLKELDYLSGYYAADSRFLKSDVARGKRLGEKRRQWFYSKVTKSFIPFLGAAGVTRLDEITPAVLCDYQDRLLAEGLKPQTVNSVLYGIGGIFKHLVRRGVAPINPCKQVEALAPAPAQVMARGCYEVTELKGVLGRGCFKDERQALLLRLVYTCGLRNSEIKRLRTNDFEFIGGCYFVNIRESKSVNGVRLVPVHEKLYRALWAYIAERGIAAGAYA